MNSSLCLYKSGKRERYTGILVIFGIVRLKLRYFYELHAHLIGRNSSSFNQYVKFYVSSVLTLAQHIFFIHWRPVQ
jgi:hypothetical protein